MVMEADALADGTTLYHNCYSGNHSGHNIIVLKPWESSEFVVTIGGVTSIESHIEMEFGKSSDHKEVVIKSETLWGFWGTIFDGA